MSSYLVSLSDSKNIKVNTRACDQCNYRRMKCNKQIPRCKSCIKSNLICSWDRPLVHEHNPNYQTVETFSIGVRQRKFLKERKKKDMEDKDNNIKNNLQDKVNKKKVKELIIKKQKHDSMLFLKEKVIVFNIDSNGRLISDDWNVIVTKWLSNTTTRCEFYHYFTLTGFTMERLEKNNKLMLIDLFNKRLDSRHNIINSLPVKNEFSSFQVKELIHLAEKAFFHFFNPFNPLFTWSSYHSRKRSNLLYFSVWLAGLRFLPESKLKQELSGVMIQRLEKLACPSKLELNIDTLQAYMIIYCSIRNSRVLLNRMWLYHSISLSLVTSLGLFKTKIIKGDFMELERILAYRYVLHLDSNGIYLASTLPKIYYTLNYNVNILDYNQFIFNYIDSTQDQDTIKYYIIDCCILLRSQLSYYETKLLYQLYLKRFYIINDFNDQYKTKAPNIEPILLFLDKAKVVFTNYIEQLLLLQQKLNNKLNNNTIIIFKVIKQTQIYFNIRYYFMIFLITTTYCNLYETYIYKRKHLYPILYKAIDSCIQLNLLLRKMGPSPFVMMRCSFLAFASHFLAKYYHLAKNQVPFINTSLIQLKYQLNEIKHCTVAGRQANTNLKLMHQILQFYKVEL